MILRTYKEWQELGYGVIKGEKSKVRKNGICYFDETQVLNIKEYYQDQMRIRNNKMVDELISK